MPIVPRVIHTLHIFALGLWLGALVLMGAAAALIFRTAKSIPVSVSGYSVPDADQWQLAGGMFAAPIFTACDVIAFACSTIAMVTLMLAWLTRRSGMTSLRHLGIRAITFGVTMVIFCLYFFVVTPSMNVNLKAYWVAAQIGDTAKAAEFKAAFDVDHPRASRLLGATAVALSAAFIAAAWPNRRSYGGPLSLIGNRPANSQLASTNADPARLDKPMQRPSLAPVASR